MRIASVLALCLLAASLGAGAASAAAPSMLSYQGVLIDGTGNPMAGPVDMTFTIYDSPGGGTALWTETHTGMPLVDGVFDVTLGSVTPLAISFDAPRYLVTEVGGTQIGPARLMSGAPFSLITKSVANGAAVRSLNGLQNDLQIVGGSNVTVSQSGDSISIAASGGGVGGDDGDWQISGSDMYSVPTGRVGIGTTNPASKLHIFSANEYGTQVRVEDFGTGGVALAGVDVIAGSVRGELGAGESASQKTLSLWTLTDGTNMQISAHEEIFLRPQNTTRLRMELDGRASFLADDATATVEIDPDHLTGQGQVTVRNAAGSDAARMTSEADGNGSVIVINDGGHAGGYLRAANSAGGLAGGILRINDELGQNRILLEGNEAGNSADGPQLTLWNDAGVQTAALDGDLGGTHGGEFELANSAGTATIEMRGQESTDPANGAAVYLRDDTGNTTIELDADYGATGQGRVITQVLEVTGGSDLSEQFDVAGGDDPLEPGTVVVIDPARPGGLAVSTRAYDRRVAGVISGAGGIRTGMVMGQHGSEADGRHPIALTGRVYVMADASNGPIEPGDLLTTSDTPGDAMKVVDHDRARGAILGKAMTSLEDGTGLVLVLVSLQ